LISKTLCGYTRLAVCGCSVRSADVVGIDAMAGKGMFMADDVFLRCGGVLEVMPCVSARCNPREGLMLDALAVVFQLGNASAVAMWRTGERLWLRIRDIDSCAPRDDVLTGLDISSCRSRISSLPTRDRFKMARSIVK